MLVRVRVATTQRTLRARTAVLVVPANEFDPTPEGVLRFAAQLSLVRRSVRGWLDTPASAVRIRLQPDPQGRLTFARLQHP